MVRIFLLYVTGFCINSLDWNLSIVIFNLTIELVRVRSVNFSILYKVNQVERYYLQTRTLNRLSQLDSKTRLNSNSVRLLYC